MALSPLHERNSIDCGKASALSADQVEDLLKQLNEWDASGSSKIRKQVTLNNFVEAVELINRIAELAEKDNHHPDIHLTSYKNLTIELSTHAVGGLSENDFILAAKIDRLL